MKRGTPLKKLLVSRFPSDFPREKDAWAAIMCGSIKVNGVTLRDPSSLVAEDSDLQIESKKFVSRGGEKLDAALSAWCISPKGKRILDAGASTGGFTDCLLQHGAAHVYSVDVGYNQLDYTLRSDPKVTVMERCNIMGLEKLDPRPDWAVADLSFRSLSKAAVKILQLTSEKWCISLLKPQFELAAFGREAEREGKKEPLLEAFNGVIQNNDQIQYVMEKTGGRLAEEGVRIDACLESPVRGGQGNREFLLRCSLQGDSAAPRQNIAVLLAGC